MAAIATVDISSTTPPVRAADVETDDYVPSHTRRWTSSQRELSKEYVLAHEVGSDNKLVKPLSSTITSGASVIFEHAKGRTFTTVKDKGTVRLGAKGGKTSKIGAVVGHPFGSAFSDENGNLIRTAAPISTAVDTSILDATFVPQSDNSNLVDDSHAQKLTHEQIEKLKKEVKSADELVAAIASNSATFEDKTEFSKEKYMKKKKAKHSTTVRALRPDTLHMMETYFLKDPKKTLFMRADTLALLLGAANTRAGITSIVIDHVGGVLGAAVAERHGGYGRILCGYDGSSSNGMNAAVVEAARKMGLSQSSLSAILHFPFTSVGDATRRIAANNGAFFAAPAVIDSAATASSSSSSVLQTLPTPAAPAASASSTATTEAAISSSSTNASPAVASTPSSSSSSVMGPSTSSVSMPWLLSGADSLLIASKYSAEHTLLPLLPLLAPSAPFAVYCQHVEPLLITGQRLRNEGLATHIQVAECWFREYQVLPARTHPHMSMSGSGGYMLTGIKIISSSASSPSNSSGSSSGVTSPATSTSSSDVAPVDTTDDSNNGGTATSKSSSNKGGNGNGKNKWLRDKKKRPRK